MKEIEKMSLPERHVAALNENFYGAVTEVGKYAKRMKKNGTYDRSKVLITVPQVKTSLCLAKRFGRMTSYDYMLAMFAGAYAFTRTKQIFRVDETLQEELGKAADENGEIPCSILMNLPYPCFYLELPSAVGTTGIMVHMDYGKYNKRDETSCYALWFYLNVFDDSLDTIDQQGLMLRLPLIENMSLAEIVKESLRDYDEQTNSILERENREPGEDLSGEWIKIINILLYICSVNADIIPEEVLLSKQEQAYAEKQPDVQPVPQSKERKQKPVNKECVWSVGSRIGAELKRHDLSSESEDASSRKGAGKGSVKRAHVRRGHFHHYWVGSLKDGSRRLVLKWIPPVVIHAEYVSSLPVVQHAVR